MKKLIDSMVYVLCVLWIGFIFFNSSRTGQDSHEISMKFANEVFTKIYNGFNLNQGQLDMVARKCAHGFEFMILVIVLIIGFSILKIKKINRVIYSLFVILLIATFDETIQLFIPGRTSKVSDILIDFCGGISGCILMGIFYAVYIGIKNLFLMLRPSR